MQSQRQKICPRCLRRYDPNFDHCPTDKANLYPLGRGDRRIGTILADRFLVLDQLGRGGMAVVYLALQINVDRLLALKILTVHEPQAEDSRVIVARFKREARITAQLHSPHTVSVHDFGELGRHELFIAMEYLRGITLESLIAKKAPLPAVRVWHLINQMCDSLAEAHQQGLVHRDFKPGNVMVETRDNDRDYVTVLDFGLAKLLEINATQLTQDGQTCGTPLYMAPEVWTADFRKMSSATDIYALGCIIFEMLTGRPVFIGDAIDQLSRMHLLEAPPQLAGFPTDEAAVGFGPIIECCLEKRPENRYQEIAQLQNDLAKLGLDRSVSQSGRPPTAGATFIRDRQLERPITSPKSSENISGADEPMSANAAESPSSTIADGPKARETNPTPLKSTNSDRPQVQTKSKLSSKLVAAISVFVGLFLLLLFVQDPQSPAPVATVRPTTERPAARPKARATPSTPKAAPLVQKTKAPTPKATKPQTKSEVAKPQTMPKPQKKVRAPLVQTSIESGSPNIRNLSVSAGISDASVKAVLSNFRSQFQRCWKRVQPTKIEVALVVARNGRPMRVRIGPKSKTADGFESCLGNGLKTAKFPALQRAHFSTIRFQLLP